MTAPAKIDAPGEAVHDLANVLAAVTASVGFLVAHTALDRECRDVVADLQECVDRFPDLLRRLRVTSQSR
jgi:hypothetical protein